jgi:hypothetical protein
MPSAMKFSYSRLLIFKTWVRQTIATPYRSDPHAGEEMDMGVARRGFAGPLHRRAVQLEKVVGKCEFV